MSGDGPAPPGFSHVGDRLVHQGHVWHVAVGTFQAPDGEEFHRDIVRSPGAVAAVPLEFDAEGNASVVLVRQYRPPYDRAIVEIPAGMRDVEGEPVVETIARELVEEAGVRAGHLEHLLDFYPSAGMTDSVLYLYLATELTRVPQDLHGPEEEALEVLHVPLDAALDMVMRGEIHDAKTIIGLLLVERRLRDGTRHNREHRPRAARGGRAADLAGHRARTVGQHDLGVPARPGRVHRLARRAGRSLATVGPADLDRYVGERHAGGAAPASVARQLAAMRMLHRFMASEGMRADDPTADLDGVKVPAGIPKPLTEAEVTALLAAPTGDDPIARRDRALLELLYATGARISEMSGLDLDDIDLDGGLVRLYGKGAKERIVPFGSHASRALVAWFDAGGRPRLAPERWARRDDSATVFLTREAVGSAVRSAGRSSSATGMPPASPRLACRHTSCATRAPRTCSTTVPTCASCRSCSVMRRCRRRRCTRRSARSGCGTHTVRRTRGPDGRREDRSPRSPLRRFAVAANRSRIVRPGAVAAPAGGAGAVAADVGGRSASLDRGRPAVPCDRRDVDRDEMAAALLHDVGKVECGLGTFGRVAATVVGPRTQRFRSVPRS